MTISEREAAVLADPVLMASIMRGIEDVKAGRFTVIDPVRLLADLEEEYPEA